MRLFPICFAALLFLLPTIARADDVAPLLAKHAAFAGWTSTDPAMASWRATGERTHGGAVDTFTEIRRGLIFHDTVSTGHITDETGFTGRYVWHSDENHFWSVQLGRAAQAAIAWDLIADETLSELHPTLESSATLDGKAVPVLRAQPAGLAPFDVYEDPSTGAFLRVVVAPGSSDSRTFDDISYATLAGGRHVINGWRDGDIHYRITNIVPAPVADTDLQAAPQIPAWTYGSAPLDMATVGDNERYVRVAASLNGHSGIFLLSTNTPSIVVFSDFAREAGLEDLGTSDFSPYLGNSQFAGYARAATLQFGGAVVHNVIVTRMVSPGNRLAGVLGYDFFAGGVVDVDLARSHIEVRDPRTAQAEPGPGGFAFPVDLTHRTPDIALSLSQGVAHPTIDTGMGGFMLLSQALRDSGRIAGHDITSQASVGFGGWGATADPIASTSLRSTYTSWNTATTSGACMVISRIMIGPYPYENPSVCLGGTNVFGDDGGLIGLDFLRHFNWIVDYPHGKFIVTPNGE